MKVPRDTHTRWERMCAHTSVAEGMGQSQFKAGSLSTTVPFQLTGFRKTLFLSLRPRIQISGVISKTGSPHELIPALLLPSNAKAVWPYHRYQHHFAGSCTSLTKAQLCNFSAGLTEAQGSQETKSYVFFSHLERWLP